MVNHPTKLDILMDDVKISSETGHEYSVTNTYITPDGYKHCRECHKLNQRRYTEKNEK